MSSDSFHFDPGYPDLKAKPADDDAGQIPRPLPWAGGDKFKVAAVICEPIWANGLLPQEASPRFDPYFILFLALYKYLI